MEASSFGQMDGWTDGQLDANMTQAINELITKTYSSFTLRASQWMLNVNPANECLPHGDPDNPGRPMLWLLR